ncbi:TPA: hypothetical protein ACGW5B_005834 [Bacillus paranthracis]
MKYVAKMSLVTILLGIMIASLPVLPSYSLGGWTSVLNKYMQFVYSFFNPWTLFACVSTLFVMNSIPFIVKIYRMVMEFFSGAS